MISAFDIDHGDVVSKAKKKRKFDPGENGYDDEVVTAGGAVAGGRGGAQLASGGGVGMRNTVRAANQAVSDIGSPSRLKQLRAASRAPGMGKLVAGGVVGAGVLGAAGNKGVDAYRKKNPRDSKVGPISGGVLLGGAGALAVKGGRNWASYQQAKTANDYLARYPKQAKKLARDLNRSGGTRTNFDVNFRAEQKTAWNQAARTEAEARNPKTRLVTPGMDRWSRNRGQVKSFRGALDKPNEPGMFKALTSKDAANWHHARTFESLQDASKPNGKTLYRASGFPKGTDFTPGKELDVHRFSSWTDDQRVADMFTGKQQTRRGKVPFTLKQKNTSGETPTLLRMTNGRALHGAPASRHFTQREYVSGGKLKIVGSQKDANGRLVLDVEQR